MNNQIIGDSIHGHILYLYGFNPMSCWPTSKLQLHTKHQKLKSYLVTKKSETAAHGQLIHQMFMYVGSPSIVNEHSTPSTYVFLFDLGQQVHTDLTKELHVMMLSFVEQINAHSVFMAVWLNQSRHGIGSLTAPMDRVRLTL